MSRSELAIKAREAARIHEREAQLKRDYEVAENARAIKDWDNVRKHMSDTGRSKTIKTTFRQPHFNPFALYESAKRRHAKNEDPSVADAMIRAETRLCKFVQGLLNLYEREFARLDSADINNIMGALQVLNRYDIPYYLGKKLAEKLLIIKLSS